MWLREENLAPFERIVYRSDVAAIGRFRCAPDSPSFRDSGPIANHVFVFPRIHVKLSFARSRSFIAGPNVVPLYNRGQRYMREAVDRRGVDSDWIAIAPDVLADAVERHQLGDADPEEHPFTGEWVSASARMYANARRAAEGGEGIDETLLEILDELLSGLERRKREGIERATHDRVEAAKEIVARDLDQPLSLRHLAEMTSTSVFHLCRIFRRSTGFSIHAYRQQLRLRSALEPVLRGDDLLEVAMRHGFYSHSHFTHMFRRTFGITPSELRRSAIATTGSRR